MAQLWTLLHTCWPRFVEPLSDDEIGIVARLMRDVPLSAAVAAVEARSTGGAVFPPNWGEIVADVREALSPTMTWATALGVLRRACSRFGPGNASGATAWLRAEEPLVADWIESYGWYRFSMEPIDNEVHGHRVANRLAASFDEHAQRASGRTAVRTAALGAGGGSPVPQIGGGS